MRYTDMEADRLRIRRYLPQDESFVLNSFMKSFVVPRLSTIGRAPIVCQLDGNTILRYWHDWMMKVLAGGQSLIACDEEDGVYILGWISCLDGELCYLYTRELARNQGVSKALLKEAGLDPKTCKRRLSTAQFRKSFGR